MGPRHLTARWICPVAAPPIERGTVGIHEGRITVVSDAPPSAAEDLGDAVIVPGLINAHTHLELSHLADRVPPGGRLVDWLAQVVQYQVADPDPDMTAATAVQAAATVCLQSGTTTVGDITRRPRATRAVLSGGPLQVVSFAELIGIGPNRPRVTAELPPARERTSASANLEIGLSPHAPYSVAADAVREIVAAARADGCRLSIHLAESPEEVEFLARGTGPFREFLAHLGLDDGLDAPFGGRPVAWAEALGVLGPRCVLAHANFVDDEDIATLCRTGTHVAYCPRTHAAFHAEPHPWITLLGAGVNVCIATDSLASSPSLSVLDELATAAGKSELSFDTLLETVTLNPARALGCADSRGTLQPGKQADLAVFACDDDPEDALLGDDRRLLRLYVRGERVL